MTILELEKDLNKIMDEKGLTFNNAECTTDDAIKCIVTYRNDGENYTAEQWVEDTYNNFPECFN